MDDFVFCATRIFFSHERNQQRKFIEPVAQLLSYISFLIKSSLFHSFSSSWQQQQYTQNFSFSLIFWVCVLSYLRFYLNGVDIQLKHSLTHCTFKARVLRQFLCAFQAFFFLLTPFLIDFLLLLPHCISCFKFTARLRSGRDRAHEKVY